MIAIAPRTAKSTDNGELIESLQDEIASLKRQLDWFKKQLFGPISEKRVVDTPEQPLLNGLMGDAISPLQPQPKQTITWQRGKAHKKRNKKCLIDSGLRFNWV